MAEQVFGDSERGWRWLRKPKQRFDGKTPIEMLATEAGAHLVEETDLSDRRRHVCVTLWRISSHASLDGAGGLRAPGRWHTRGRRIVYCAPNPATALLEVLVHAEIDLQEIPAKLSYLEIEAPDSLAIESIDLTAFGQDWK